MSSRTEAKPYENYRDRRRRAKDFLQRRLHDLFVLGQAAGIDVLPRHFYSEIPDVRALRRETAWRSPRSMVGVQGASLAGQLAFLESCVSKAPPAGQDVYAAATRLNGDLGYEPTDAAVLYKFMAAHKPRRVVQVGCGVSTAVALLAADAAGYAPDVTCIEPFPTAYLQAQRDRGAIRLVQQRAQDVPIDLFLTLGEGDLLFVDSTHTLTPGGEVPRIILEVLPNLRPGCFVHFHDIWFPYDYPPHLLTSTLFFWHESALLHAFLIGNRNFELVLSLSMLFHGAFEDLQRQEPSARAPQKEHGSLDIGDRYPSSAYLRVTA